MGDPQEASVANYGLPAGSSYRATLTPAVGQGSATPLHDAYRVGSYAESSQGAS